jgi:hypothetical protein
MPKQQFRRKLVANKERYVLWIIVGVLTVSQAVSGFFLVGLWNWQSSQRDLDEKIVTNMGNDRTYKYGVVDVPQDKVFLPELRLSLPLNDTTRNLRYTYSISVKGQSSLYLTTTSAVGMVYQPEDVYCKRMVALTELKMNSNMYDLISDIRPTIQGLTHIYTPKGCAKIDNSALNELVEAAKNAQEY